LTGLTNEQLSAWSAGTLAADELTCAVEHTTQCGVCSEAIAGMLNATRSENEPEHLSGRYQLRGLLGSGGMGVVQRAFDCKLNREVALKMIRSDRPESELTGLLIKEAQAMAKVSHPNVGVIHEVVHMDGEIFLAMAIVNGVPLSEWLSGSPSSQQRHAVVVAIARGLTAIHDAGLIHRDLKPDNIVVLADNTPVVIDFGIAMGADRDEFTAAGTPGYMAPELSNSASATTRSDIYAWWKLVACTVTKPTFALRREIVRGTASAPEQRHATAGLAIESFERALRSGRKHRQWFSVLTALAIALLFIVVYRARQRSHLVPCLQTAVEGWSLSDRIMTIAGLQRAGVDAVPVVTMIDRYAADTVGFRNAQCVDNSNSATGFGRSARRRICADHAWDEIDAIANRIKTSNPDEIKDALDNLVMAPPPAVCVDGDLSAIPMVEPSWLGVVADHSLRDLRQSTMAPSAKLASLLAMQSWVLALQQPPLTVNFLMDLGAVYATTGDTLQAVATLRDAVATTESSRDDQQRAKANIQILRALFVAGQTGVDDAVRNAKDAVGRIHNPAMTAWLDQSEGLIEVSRGNTDKAIGLLQNSVAYYQRIGLPYCRYNVTALQNLASAYQYAQKLDQAQVFYDRAFAASAQRFGIGHRETVVARGARATNLMYRQQLDEAASELQSVADDLDKMSDSNGPDQMQVLGYLCELHQSRNETALADIACLRALAIGEKTFGLDHPQITWPLGLVGQLLLTQKKPIDAEVFLRRAHSIFQHGSVLPNEQAHNQALLAIALARQGHRTKEALTMAAAAIMVLAKEPTATERLTLLRSEFPALKLPQ
jgi:eukaryotic-like serine/threonine-protein kinase